MDLYIFARFHAASGQSDAVAAALAQVASPTREEPGCLDYRVFRSALDPGLFFVQSRWIDEAAFNRHADLPHTVTFISTVEKLIDHPLDITRSHRIL